MKQFLIPDFRIGHFQTKFTFVENFQTQTLNLLHLRKNEFVNMFNK